MELPQLPNTFTPSERDRSDPSTKFVFAVGPLHAAVAEQLAAVVDGCDSIGVELISTSARSVTLEAAYASLTDPEVDGATKSEVARTLDPSGEHYIPALLGKLTTPPAEVFVVSGADPDALDRQWQAAKSTLARYLEACTLLLPYHPLVTLEQAAYSAEVKATGAQAEAMAAQLLEQSGSDAGSVGIVIAPSHHAIPQLVSEAGFPVSTTVVGTRQLPNGAEYGSRIVSQQTQTIETIPELRELQNRVLLTDLLYTSGVLLPRQSGLTGYDYHLARVATQEYVERLSAVDVLHRLTILSNLNVAVGDMDRSGFSGDASINRQAIVGAGRILMKAMVEQ
jgi:hypothetical protein